MAKITQCKTCSKEIASNAKSCPECGEKNKKPIYKRPWFIVIAFFVIVGAIAGAIGDDSTTTDSGTAGTGQEISQDKKTEEDVLAEKTEKDVPAEKTEKDVPTEKVEEDAPTEKVEDVPTEYKSALKKAKIYSDTMSMSKAGLYDQLTSEYGEKFTAEAAQYAIENVEADWNKNALEKAKTYQETMSMSPSAIYDQLISEYGEKFTEEEAQYAIDNLE